MLDEAYPVGDVFGVDIYEATHENNQKIYITINRYQMSLTVAKNRQRLLKKMGLNKPKPKEQDEA